MRLSLVFLLVFFVACSGGDTSSQDGASPAEPGSEAAAPETAPETAAETAVEPSAPATDANPGAEAPKYLAASHILVQYAGGMRAKKSVTRTKEEAKARADEVLAKVLAGGDFASLAKEYSDGPSGPKGGGLGTFPPNRMIPEFSKAVAGVEIGAVVEAPVETGFGFHIIKRNDAKMFKASHILVQYKGSMRANPSISRTKDEARTFATEVLTKAKAEGADFSALAKEYSDGPTKKKGGDLGEFPGGVMHPDFEKGVASVEANTLVPDLVETPFGFHIIHRR